VSVSYCSRELRKLVKLGLADDVGRSKLDPCDPLYGRYYMVRRSGKISQWSEAKAQFRLRPIKGVGGDKIVKFSGGREVRRHYLFATSAAFWIVDFLSNIETSESAVCFPETYLRSSLGWHRGAGPSKKATNPRLTMVPDALIIYRQMEIRVEAEITPKTRKAYECVFGQLRSKDDTVIYVYPDAEVMGKVEGLLPSSYRVGGVVLGDNGGLGGLLRRLVLSLFDR
jgi:hypothetical protein